MPLHRPWSGSPTFIPCMARIRPNHGTSGRDGAVLGRGPWHHRPHASKVPGVPGLGEGWAGFQCSSPFLACAKHPFLEVCVWCVPGGRHVCQSATCHLEFGHCSHTLDFI